MVRVVVVGAGVVGSAVAMRLAEGGATVTVVDAVRPASGASGGSFAWLNANEKRPRHYYEMNLRGLREHRVLAARFGQWYHPVGNLEWADPDGSADLAARAEQLRDWGYAVRVLTRKDGAVLEPALSVPRDVTELVFFPEEGYVDGALLVGALLAHARSLGAEIITGEEVVGLDQAGGRVVGVRLRYGRINADVVVLCAGWRTTELAAEAGVRVPLVSPHRPGSRAVCLLAETEPVPAGVRRVVHAPGLVMRPAGHGRVLLEPDHIPAGLVFGEDPPAEPGAQLLAAARAVLPGLADRGLAVCRLCVRPMPEDRYPIVGWCPGLDNCYVAVMHSGITLAPYVSRLVAAEVLGGSPVEDLDPYRPSRFAAAG